MNSIPKISSAQKAGLSLALGVILSGIIYWQGIIPAQARITQLLEQGQERAQLVANVRALSQQEDYEDYAMGQQAQLNDLKKRLPKVLSLEEQVNQYYELAESEGVVLQRLQIPPRLDKQEQEIKLQLCAQGPYYAVVNFIHDLEGEGYYLALERIRLQGEKDNLVTLSAQLVIANQEKINRAG